MAKYTRMILSPFAILQLRKYYHWFVMSMLLNIPAWTKGRRGALAIYSANYAGFSNISKWAISADTVSANKNWSIEMVLLT